ncbi:MAG: hypothetical protein QM802_19535 [Agriterribacter sp.]
MDLIIIALVSIVVLAILVFVMIADNRDKKKLLPPDATVGKTMISHMERSRRKERL